LPDAEYKAIRPHLVRLPLGGTEALHRWSAAVASVDQVVGISFSMYDIHETFVRTGAPLYIVQGTFGAEFRKWDKLDLADRQASRVAQATLDLISSPQLETAVDDIHRLLPVQCHEPSIRVILVKGAIFISHADPVTFVGENHPRFNYAIDRVHTRGPLCTIAVPEPMSNHDSIAQQSHLAAGLEVFLSCHTYLAETLLEEHQVKLVAPGADDLTALHAS
jgi:hypothetical protein